jgi:hypothetical protein
MSVRGPLFTIVIGIALVSLTGIAQAQPVVDGIFDPAEWSGAVTYPVAISLPEGGTTPGTLYVTNDATDIYIALRYERTTIDAMTSLQFIIDWRGSGLMTPDNDRFVITANACSGFTLFTDSFITLASPPCYPGIPCAPEDKDYKGTEDGAGAIQRDGVWMTYEMRHPLASGDFRDMFVRRGSPLEFFADLALINAAYIGASSMHTDHYRVR